MNKHQFLNELANSLKGFSYEEVGKTLSFYDELISDKVESGQDEQFVIYNLGDIRSISLQMQAELLGERVKESFKKGKSENRPAVDFVDIPLASRNEFSNNTATSYQPPTANHIDKYSAKLQKKANKAEEKRIKKGVANTMVQQPLATDNLQMQNYGENFNNQNPQFVNYQQSVPNQLNEQQAANQQTPKKRSNISVLIRLMFSAPILIPFAIIILSIFFSLTVAMFSTALGLGVASFVTFIGAIPFAVLAGMYAGGVAWGLLIAGSALLASGVTGILTVIAFKIAKFATKVMIKFMTLFVRAFFGRRK